MSRFERKGPMLLSDCYAPVGGSADTQRLPRGGSASVQPISRTSDPVMRASDPGPIPRGADLLDEDLDLIAKDLRDVVIHCLRTHIGSSDFRAELVRTLRWRLGRRPCAVDGGGDADPR